MPEQEKFRIAFVCHKSLSVLDMLDEAHPSLDILADSTHQMTERRVVCVPIPLPDHEVSEDEGAALAVVPQAKSKGRPRKQHTTNALLACIHGFTTMRYTKGSVERRAGGILKERTSFNPRSITLAQGGESELLYNFNVESLLEHAQRHHPTAYARLRTSSSTCSDFTGGCQNSYIKTFGASFMDKYIMDAGVLKPSSSCQLRGCCEHALENLTGAGKTGRAKLRAVGNEEREARATAARCRVEFSARRLGIVQFDLFWYWTLQELRSGTIAHLGLQEAWAAYLEKQYLFKEDVLGVSLYNAIWRAGVDRGSPRPTDNPGESYNKKIKLRMTQITNALLADVASNIRPSLPAMIKRLELALEVDDELHVRHEAQRAHRRPLRIDPNLLTGHPSSRQGLGDGSA